jgi:beta-N-acetylhexosaminidase
MNREHKNPGCPKHMKKNSFFFVLLILPALLLAGCARQVPPVREDTPGDIISEVEKITAAEPDAEAEKDPPLLVIADDLASDKEVMRILAGLTLRQKIGQTFSLAIYGNENQAYLDNFLREFQPGLIFYLGSIINNIPTMQLTNKHIRALYRRIEAPLDPIIALDQEGGTVARLSKNVAQFPSAMAMAASGDAELVRKAGMAIGRQVRRAGCTMVYAPVLDLNLATDNPVIGTRAFSDDRSLVLRYGRAFSKGLMDADVLPVAKHFPGHGRSSVDSHFGLPVISAPREDLLRDDFAIFKALEEKSFPAIMTGHVVYSAIDTLPATLSKKIIRDWFVEECGYTGLIMTDAVQMKALSANWSYSEIYARALQAGVHLITTGMAYPDCRAVMLECERMVAGGRLAVEVIDAAAARVIAFKLRQKKYLDEPSLDINAARLEQERQEDAALVRQIAQASITLIQDPEKLLPLREGVPIHILSTNPRFLEHLRALLPEKKGHRLGVHEVVRGNLAASQNFIQRIRAEKGVFIFAGEYASDARFIESLPEDIRQGMVIVALQDPWFARRFMHKNAYLATYSAVDPSLEACARVLLGLAKPQGRSPVKVAADG